MEVCDMGRGRRPGKPRLIVLAGLSLLLSLPANAACVPTVDQKSVGMRALETELMVAGLKCGAERWNSFALHFKTTLKVDADRLQTLFRKKYGRGGAERMNSFVTQLANDASQRSNEAAQSDYCRQEDELFGKVLSLTGAELERFSASRDLAVPAPVSLCKPDNGLPAATVAAVRPSR